MYFIWLTKIEDVSVHSHVCIYAQIVVLPRDGSFDFILLTKIEDVSANKHVCISAIVVVYLCPEMVLGTSFC